MKARKIVLALAAGTTLLAAAPAFADPPQWAPAHGWRARHHHPHYYYRVPAYVVYPARPVVVVPPPVYYAPPPVLYGHIPVGPRVAVSFGVRL